MIPEAEDALIVLDGRGRISRATVRAAALLGAAVTELIGRPWGEVHPRGDVGLTLRKHTLQGRSRRSALTLITLAPTAGSGPGEVLVEPWNASTELAVARDMTGRVLAVNSAFARKFGVPAGHWPGRDLSELLHPDDLDDWRGALLRQERPPYRGMHEHRWQTAQGWRWLSWEEHAVRGGSGQIVAFRAVGRDVTKRRLAEEHFHKLAEIVEQSPLSVVLTMPDGRVEYVNPCFAKTSGYTLEEIFERRIEVLRAGLESDEQYASVLQTVHGGQTWRGELRTCSKSGRDRWEAVQVSSIRDHDDRITHLLCLREDITERRGLEGQLRQSQKMESIGTLAGGISHDFNNLLAIIGGFCEMAQMRAGGDGRLSHHLGEIQKATRRATGLVRQILTFSRRQEASMQPVDLNHAVEELVRMFKETFPRNIDLQTDLQHALPWVQADGNQLQQIVMNLCVNARDAMPGGGRLLLRTCERPGTSLVRMGGDPHLTYASLEVCDSGHGMSPEVLARIFEPFYTTKEKNSGTGLGLAVVYGIVTGHGGLLDVQSVPGRGTTFFVHLPFPQTGAACVADVSEEGGGVPPGTERILVVEDEPGVRGLFTTAFGEAGYRVSTAADGAAAVEMLLGSPAHFDAVLLDLNLPRIDGLQVLTAVRRERPGAAVVIVSGHVTPEVRTELERAGDTEIVCKPCGLGELGRAVRRVLARVPA